jgi:hypothetical protein
MCKRLTTGLSDPRMTQKPSAALGTSAKLVSLECLLPIRCSSSALYNHHLSRIKVFVLHLSVVTTGGGSCDYAQLPPDSVQHGWYQFSQWILLA